MKFEILWRQFPASVNIMYNDQKKKIIEEWFGLPFSKKASDMNCDFKGLNDSMIEPAVGNGI